MNQTAAKHEIDTLPAISALAEFDPFSAKLDEFRERFDGVVYDFTNPDDEKRARSDRYAVGVVLADLDRAHKRIKEPILEATRRVDGRRRDIREQLTSIQAGIKEQIEAHEQIERARVAALEERIESIHDLIPGPDSGAEMLSERLAQAEAIDPADYDDHAGDAAHARHGVIEELRRRHGERLAYESEQAELARLRAEAAERERAERDARIAREAEERAKAEAERVAAEERERVELEKFAAKEAAEREIAEAKAREQQAERARIQAEADARAAAKAEKLRAEEEIAKAKAAAERAAAEERQRIEREQREAERIAAEERVKEDARKARQQHRKKIHSEVLESLVSAGVAEDVARNVVELIRDGKVSRVAIEY